MKLAALSLVLLSAAAYGQSQELTVSAATSLSNALPELGKLFAASEPSCQGKCKVVFNFAASGVLVQQIAQGAPLDVLITADQESMQQAQVKQLVTSPQIILHNTLVLVVATRHSVLPQNLSDLLQPSYKRIAVANPASVPAGRYARAALQKAGLWQDLQARLIMANNVRQALDYVARGEVDAGFVYASDAALMPNKLRLAFKVASSEAVIYPAALVQRSQSKALAERFIKFLSSPSAQLIWQKYGFASPGAKP